MLPHETETFQGKESLTRSDEVVSDQVVTDPIQRPQFPVVGVGASAGGLDAFTRLLGNLPPKSGMAFLFILHLDPKRESILPEILAASSPMPVRHAQQGMLLEPNQVYVSPPNAIVTVTDGHLQVSPRPEIPRLFMPIDFMLRSLALTMGRRYRSGSLGRRHRRQLSGCRRSRKRTASHSRRMRSRPLRTVCRAGAILTGCVDYVLDPAGIAQELLRISSHPYLATAGEPGTSDLISDTEEAELQKIFGLLRRTTRVDFGRYKRSTVLRRVRRRMSLRRVEQMSEYLRLLQNDPEEISALYQDFLIRVTSFFRDPKAFDILSKEVLAVLVKQRPADEPIRIWVSGCATGEEVYSVAICVMETLGKHSLSTPVKILATDVNERALEVARAGMYIENIQADVSPERLRRFFTQVDNCYQISKSIREICVFSRHDISRDPPFARLDLVTCRNLLIYLNLAVQRRVLPLFHYALNPGGYLMLGPSETIGAFGDLFTPVNSEHKIFAKQMTATRPHLEFDPADPLMPRGAGSGRDAARAGGARARRLFPGAKVDRLLLSQFAPAGVLIDDDLRIIQFRGQTDPYLAPAPGVASFDLLKMAREGLMAELRTAVNLARDRNELVRRPRLAHRQGRQQPPGGDRSSAAPPARLRPALLPGPLRAQAGSERCTAPAAESVSPPTECGTTALDEAQLRRQIVELRRELDVAREYLQSVIEEQESTNEELKSANEEILSSNEELQSTNEELQTAKEETQSANEELATVNEELQHRNRRAGPRQQRPGQPAQRRQHSDRHGQPRPAHPPLHPAGREGLQPDPHRRRPADQRYQAQPQLPRPGRRIEASSIGWPPRSTKSRPATATGTRCGSGPTSPWRTRSTAPSWRSWTSIMSSAAAEQLKDARDRAEAIVETVWQPLVVLDPRLKVIRANRAFLRMFGTSQEKVEGRPLPELGPGPWMNQELVAALRTIPTTGQPLPSQEIEVDSRPAGTRCTASLRLPDRLG